MATIHHVQKFIKEGNIKRLIRSLKDRDLAVRREAAAGLGKLESSDAVPALIDALNTNIDQYVIRNTLTSLRQINNPQAQAALIQAYLTPNSSLSRLAEKEIRQIKEPFTEDSLVIKKLLQENAFDAIHEIGENTQRLLHLVVNSELYRSWPTAKQRKLGDLIDPDPGSIEDDVHKAKDNLADLGIFVDGIHDIGDLLDGLRSPALETRIASAKKIQQGDYPLTRLPLKQAFRKEIRTKESPEAAAAILLALSVNEASAQTDRILSMLHSEDYQDASFAAAVLVSMRTKDSTLILFEFVRKVPEAPAFRDVSIGMRSLLSIGPSAIDFILSSPETHDEDSHIILCDLLQEIPHPERILLLFEFAISGGEAIQDRVLDILVSLNTESAARTIRDLRGTIPDEKVIRALSKITIPSGPAYLKAVHPESTIIKGQVLNHRENPIKLAEVFFVTEGGKKVHGHPISEPISVKSLTGASGDFIISIPNLDEKWYTQVKIVLPEDLADSNTRKVYQAHLDLLKGVTNEIIMKIDEKFGHLIFLEKD